MTIPSGNRTEILKTVYHNTHADISAGISTLTTTATSIFTIISLLYTNTHATNEAEFNLFWSQSGSAVSPSTGSDATNLYLILTQVVPPRRTFILNDKIVLPQHAGTLKFQTETAVGPADIILSYLVQDWSSE